MEFVIPLNKEDLLQNRACDGYIVKDLFDPAKLGEKLEDCNAQFRNEGAVSILNHFDVFYSLLHHSNRLKEDLKQQAWEILLSNLTIHVNSLPMILLPDGLDTEERQQQLCALKMESYILTQFIEGFESNAAKPDITADVGKKGKSAKKKNHISWDWSVERNHVLVLINKLLQLEIQRLWDPPVVEEEFVNLFSGVCYKMLENPVVVRQKEDRDMIINILGQLIKRYNHQLGASMKMIQLLQHFEHLVSPLAQALTTFVVEFGAKNLVCDVIREIGRMDSSDLSRDTSGTRSFSQFIVEIADKIPNQVLPNISLLMSHLDGDSYTMRNGVLGVFGEIVMKILSKEDLDDNMKKSRESFLDKLEEHIHDVHAFVRSKDLQVWVRLCQEKAIPISRQARIIDLVIGRLSDKSSQVRKYAVQFLKASLIGNPFAAKLPIEQLTSSLEKESEKLKQMDPQANLEDNEQENAPTESTSEESEEEEGEKDGDEAMEEEEKDGEEPMELDLEAAVALQQQSQEGDGEALAKQMELEKQKVLVNYLKDCVKFAEQMRKAIPALCQLLQSKTSSDVLETIDFFIAAYEFGLSHSEEGIRRMANLVWSRDAVVKKAVVNAFERLYIDVSCENARNKPTLIVQSLTSLITDANLGELTSLEELVYELMKMELIPHSVIQLLWQRFSLKIPQTSIKDQRIAITILSMIAGAEKDIIKSNLSVLAEHGLNGNDFLLARDTCSAILKLLQKEKNSIGSSAGEPFRLPSDHNLFAKLEVLLKEGLHRMDELTWTPFSEQALAVIYNLAESPDTIAGRVLKVFVKSLMGHGAPEDQAGETKSHPLIVARVLSASGQIALLHLYHLDVSIFSELKRRHGIREEANENKGKSSKAKTPGSRRKSKRDSSASTLSSMNNKESGLDEDMGVGGAAAEDAEAEYIRKICEHEIVLGQNLLSIFAPVAVMICSNPSKYKKPELRSSAALALAKFMLVSSEFCVQHLQLIFTILEKSDTPTVRCNMMIALGDLCFRFPNLIEPWTAHLYARLRDESVEVRKTAVTILTHLILNDMLKVKGQISEMAVCLEDKEEKIASSAKMLFSELGRKGNALYNIAPDIISRLSDPDAGVDEKMFRKIMKFILQFIQKDKQAESLVEKLCHRFRATRTDRQWRDLSFCLSVLPYNEKTLKKLMENIRCYHDKLSDEEVFNFFTDIVAKCKKFAKVEFKALIEEFESSLKGYHSKGMEENADFDKAAKVLSSVNDKNTNEANKSRKKTTTKSKSKAKPWEVEDSEEEELDPENENGEDKENKTLPGRRKRKNREKGRKTVRLNPVFSSDDDDLFD